MSDLAPIVSAAIESLNADDPVAAFQNIHEYLTYNSVSVASLPQLSGALDRIAAYPSLKDSLPTHRLALLSGRSASGFMRQAIVCALAREGVVAQTFEGGYDSYKIEILDPNGALYEFEPECILIGLSWRDFVQPLDSEQSYVEGHSYQDQEIESFRNLWSLIGSRLAVPVIQHVIDRPPQVYLGASERTTKGGVHSDIESLNMSLMGAAPGFVYWLDLDALSAQVGRRTWNSDRDYHAAKIPFSLKHLDDYATWFGAVYRSAFAKSKKCLVLDLDGTMWGGIIGDDGLDGIVFGSGTPQGEAYLSFCSYLKDLKDRGVILAINSKNDPDVAKAVFTMRQDMPLDLEDFAVFVCNWEDKAANIERIARDLNIATDSIVFIDDTLAECERVRRAMPDVRTVCLPKDPSQFIMHVDGLRLFDSNRLNDADMTRAASYHALRQAADDRAPSESLEVFLSSLNMVARVESYSPMHLERLSQMQSRINQFNLATRRYTSDQIIRFSQSESAHFLILSMRDKYADHGVVSSVLVIQEGDSLRIDDWLMSCRVFSRTVEHFLLNHMVSLARSLGVSRIHGEFIRSDKNSHVATLYRRLGFGRGDEECGFWTLDVTEDAGEQPTFVTFAEADAK